MFVHNLDPTIFSLGPIEVRYYGLVYALGFLIAYWLLRRYRDDIGLKEKDIDTLLVYLMIGMLAGARIFEAVFWQPSYYLSDPLRIFYIWEGGMAFHGGLIGMGIGAYIFSRKKGKSFLRIADLLSLPGVLFLGIGRLANFVNGELPGRIAENLPWCVKFPYHEGCRHPSQLYEAFKRFLVFGILILLRRNAWKAGFIFWNFLFLDNLGRVITDIWRDDPSILLGFNMGQLQSLVFAIVALYFIFRNHRDDLKSLFSLKRKAD
ncbi:MAG: prolipoprotein diacylglyceryl transferase [Nanobdellota archaeon]